MKLPKALAIAVTIILAQSLMAQTVNVTFEPQAKGVAKHRRQTFVGSDGNCAVFLQNKGTMSFKIELASYDMQQNELARVAFCKTKIDGLTPLVNIEKAMVNGNRLDLLLSSEKEHVLTVYHEQRDMATLQVIGENKLLARIEGEDGDQFYTFSSISPNGKLVGLATVRQTKFHEATIRATLYSRELNEYWSMSVPVHSFNQILVTDEGDIVLAWVNGEEQRGTVSMSVTDGESSEKYTFNYNTNGFMINNSLGRYANGKLLVVATLSATTGRKLTGGSNIDCVDAITLDTKTGSTSIDRRRFTNEELCLMENREGTTTNSQYMFYCTLEQVLPDNEGAFVIIDNKWDTYSTSQYGSSLSYRTRRGMMVLRIGEDGRFEWADTRRSRSRVGALYTNWGDYRWQYTPNGIMLARATSKNDVGKQSNVPVNEIVAFSDANLTVLCIDRKGNTTEAHFDIGKQCLLDCAWPLQDGSWLVFVSEKKKGAFGKIHIEY